MSRVEYLDSTGATLTINNRVRIQDYRVDDPTGTGTIVGFNNIEPNDRSVIILFDDGDTDSFRAHELVKL